MRAIYLAAGLAAAMLVAACSSLSGPSPRSAGGATSLDLVNDDLASAILVVDMPLSVQPVEPGPTFTYAVRDENAPPFLDTRLVRGDAELVVGALPAPAEGRLYHVYVLSEDARQKMRALQTFARRLPETPAAAVGIVPRVCLAGAVDKANATITVHVVVPGRGARSPLIVGEPLSALEARSSAIGPC